MSTIDEAIENVLKLSKTPENREKISTRLCKLAAILDPKLSEVPRKNPSQTPFIIPEIQKSQTEAERRRVEIRLSGFDGKNSDAWAEICEAFGPNLSQNELLSIAQVISFHAKLRLDREAKRRKEVLIKWFQENLSVIRPFLNRLILEDCDGNRIGPSVN